MMLIIKWLVWGLPVGLFPLQARFSEVQVYHFFLYSHLWLLLLRHVDCAHRESRKACLRPRAHNESPHLPICLVVRLLQA